MKYFYDPVSGGLFNDKTHVRDIPDGWEIKSYRATQTMRKGLKKITKRIELSADTPLEDLPDNAEPFVIKKFRKENFIPSTAFEISEADYKSFIQNNGQKNFDKDKKLVDVAQESV